MHCMKANKRYKAILIAMILFLPLVSTNTHAYWVSGINGSFSYATATIHIGTWTFESEEPQDPDYSDVDGITAVIDTSDPATDWNTVYDRESLLIIDGSLIYVQLWQGQSLTQILNGPGWWDAVYFGWEFRTYAVYRTGDVVVKDGVLYLAIADFSGKADAPYPGMNGNNQYNWFAKQYPSDPWVSNGSYEHNQPVYHNGHIYQLINVSNAHIEPGTQNDSWNRVDSYDYQPLNQYQTGDYVIYENQVYRATSPSSGVVPTNTSSWSPY